MDFHIGLQRAKRYKGISLFGLIPAGCMQVKKMNQDAELLSRYVDHNDQAAFSELVDRHLNLVYCAALRLVGGDAHAARDVSQAVFVDLARKARALSKREVLASWLHTSTRYAASKARRSEERRRKYEKEAGSMDDNEATEAKVVNWEELRPVIDDAVHRLGSQDRGAVLLRYFEGRSYSEIGGALGVTEDAARMRVERALEKLRILLGRRGITSTGAALGFALSIQPTSAAPAGLAASITNAALAGGTATAAGLFTAMSTSKLTASVTIAAVLLSCVGSVYETRAARAAEQALGMARRDAFALSSRLAAERGAKAGQAPEAGGPQTPPNAEEEVKGPFGSVAPGSRARGRALMDAFPEIRDRVVQDTRTRLRKRFFPLYRELGLSDTQVDEFEMIMIAGISTTVTDVEGLGTVTLDAAPSMPWSEKEAKLRALLGSPGFERFDDYRNGRGGLIVQVAASLYHTEAPLTEMQARQLRAVIAELPLGGRSPSEYWARVRERARGFLADPQLAVLESFEASELISIDRQAWVNARGKEAGK